MIQLTLAASFFVGIHFLIAGTRWRDRLIAKYGERIYRGGFSILSLAGLVWLIYAYRHAPYIETWGQLAWFKPVAALLMLIAFILAVTGCDIVRPRSTRTPFRGRRHKACYASPGILPVGNRLWAAARD